MRGERDSVAAGTKRNSEALQTGVRVVRRYGTDARRVEPICGDASAPAVRDASGNRKHANARNERAGAENVTRLASGIAHELNNQLGVVLNYSYILRRQLSVDAGVQQHLEELQEAAWRATQLTQRLSAAGSSCRNEERALSLNDVIEATQPLLASILGERIGLHTQLAEELWTVQMARPQVEQMLVDIMTHARDAMGGEGMLTLRTANVSASAVPARLHSGAEPTADRYVLLATLCPSSDILHPEIGKQSHRLGPSMIAKTVREAGGLLRLQRDSGKHRLTVHLPAL